MRSERVFSVILATLLSGCAVQTENNVRHIDGVTAKTQQLVDEQPSGTIRKYSKHVDTPFVGIRVADAAPARNIPAVLTGKLPVSRLAFDRPLTLREFADRISEIAKVPVVVSEEVKKGKEDAGTVVVNFGSAGGEMTLDHIMDLVLWPANLNWTWQENRVVISRTITRTWEIKAQLDVTLDEGDGLPAGVTGGAVASSTAAKTTQKDTASSDTWQKITGDIKRLIGTPSDVEVNKYTGTVTVRGTRDQMDAIDGYIRQINHQLNRVVAIHFDTYRIKLTQSAGAGADFQAVINGAVTAASMGSTSAVPAGAATIAAKSLVPSSVSTPTTSNLGSQGSGLSGLQGSTVVLQALQSIGSTAHSLERVVRTRNRMRTSINVDTSQTFVCQTTPATTANGVTTPGSAQQCMLSSGFKLGVAPAVADDGGIALSYKLELSEAGDPVTFSTGGTSVQNVAWQTLSEHSNVVVKAGEPLVVATLKTVKSDAATSKGLLSASAGGDEDNERTVVVMTAYLER